MPCQSQTYSQPHHSGEVARLTEPHRNLHRLQPTHGPWAIQNSTCHSQARRQQISRTGAELTEPKRIGCHAQHLQKPHLPKGRPNNAWKPKVHNPTHRRHDVRCARIEQVPHLHPFLTHACTQPSSRCKGRAEAHLNCINANSPSMLLLLI